MSLNSLKMPKHIAIVMDGNGRWAKKRLLPRKMGHKAGVNRLHEIVSHCGKLGVNTLTLFAFGRENWQRPKDEVSALMKLFATVMIKEVDRLHQNNVQIKMIGDRTRLDFGLVESVKQAELLTSQNTGLKLRVAIDYSGCWDIVMAAQKIAQKVQSGLLNVADIDQETFQSELVTGADFPVDLFIRTSGEKRISNFLLWQIAYAELYFTETLWPDFKSNHLDEAIKFFNGIERRFGQTSEQLKKDDV